jgi:hypothetical protein
MPTFLTTLNTSSHIEQVIQQSQRRLTLITPYLRVNHHLLNRLREADQRGVEIHLVYGKNELHPDEMAKVREIKRLKLYFLDHLHAKCYANERHVIVSSMNLYEFSEKNNREMSVLLSSEDGEAIAAARAEIQSIVDAATLQQPPGRFAAVRALFAGAAPAAPAVSNKQAAAPAAPASRQKQTGAPAAPASPQRRHAGLCIRCGDGIRYAPRTPLCDECYGSWAAWGNEDYPEKRCHRCGNSANVSKARPLCPECFRQDPFTRSAS